MIGVLQVMDTHLHHLLSQRYAELEMLYLLEQQRVKAYGCPTRSRESCCRDLLAAWRHADTCVATQDIKTTTAPRHRQLISGS